MNLKKTLAVIHWHGQNHDADNKTNEHNNKFLMNDQIPFGKYSLWSSSINQKKYLESRCIYFFLPYLFNSKFVMLNVKLETDEKLHYIKRK